MNVATVYGISLDNIIYIVTEKTALENTNISEIYCIIDKTIRHSYQHVA